MRAPRPEEYRNIFVNQFAGARNANNQNCGFASGLMSLRSLGIPDPEPKQGEGGLDYRKTMALRERAGGAETDLWPGDMFSVPKALRKSGAEAEHVQGRLGTPLQGIRIMKDEFTDPARKESFIALGNPERAWPDESPVRTFHFVTIAAYDPAKDVFVVLDPAAEQPFPASPDQVQRFLDPACRRGLLELIRVTRPDEPSSAS